MVQQHLLADALLLVWPRPGAQAVEMAVGVDDVIASHASKVGLELLYLPESIVRCA